MNILFISSVYPTFIDPTKGTFNRSLVRALNRRHQVRVIAPVSWLDDLRARGGRGARQNGRLRSLALDDVPVDYPRYYYSPKVLRRFYGRFYWHSMRHSLARLLAAWRPDVVIAFWAHPDGEAAIRAAHALGVASAVIVGGSDVLVLGRDPGRRRCVRNVLSAADAVVAVSDDLQKRVINLGISPEKVHVWARGIDVSLFSPGDRCDARRRLGIPPTRPSLLWVGRMDPVKGLDILIESCVLLRERGVDFQLYLIGAGPLRGELIAQVEAKRLSEQITFVGPKLHDELPDWYRAADLTVLPSRSEGLPNVLRESLACGSPFVASNVGGIAEIADPRCSMLVPPEDPSALADALAQGLARWGGNGSAIAPVFPTWDESADALMKILKPYVGSRAVNTYKEVRAPRACADRIGLMNPDQHKATKLMSLEQGDVPSFRESRAGRGFSAEKLAAPSWTRQAIRRALAAILPARLFLTHGSRRHRSVCVTFDDGPDPELTPALLDVLRDCGIKATFFVIGEKVERHPGIVTRIAAEGHCVASHGFYHNDPASTSAGQLLEEVRRTAKLLGGLLGHDVRLFRPPHGSLTASKLLSLWKARQTVVLWNVDPKDYQCKTAQELHDWFGAHALQAGDLVLLHDKIPHAIEIVPSLSKQARASGLTFATVSDWVSS
jgi:glycosyltransferase involved in cell wall biosynthesis/peptidoglycan/xylan/chitin deacetylase (PgdA/CDA1 family)